MYRAVRGSIFGGAKRVFEELRHLQAASAREAVASRQRVKTIDRGAGILRAADYKGAEPGVPFTPARGSIERSRCTKVAPVHRDLRFELAK
jgi:hypothetical protein